MRQTVFVLLWAGMAAAVVIKGGRMPYQMFYIMCVIFALAVLYMLGVFFLVKARFRAESGFTVSGESAVVETRLYSAFILPVPALALTYTRHIGEREIKWQTAVSLFPFRPVVLHHKAVFNYRGVYKVGLQSWRAGDYFGIFGVKRRVNSLAEITVLPRIVSMNERPPLPPAEQEDNTQTSLGTELSGARPYVSADSMRSVHWKLSAKGEELYVKQFSGLKRPPVWVVTDMTELSGKQREVIEDKLLETSLSLTRHLLDAHPVNTASVTDVTVIKALRSGADFNEHYQTIGLAEFKGTAFHESLVQTDFGGEGIMWIVTSRTDVPQIAELMAQGWDTRLLVVSHDCGTDVLSGLNGMGARAEHIPLDGTVAAAAWMLL